MAKKKPKPKPPAFVVKLRGAAPDDLRALNGKIAKAVKDHINDLRRRGCAAAGYRLSGPPPWNKICSTHLGSYRVLVAFPSDTEVVVLKVAPHDDNTDPYAEIAHEFGIAVSAAERTKPACCDPDGDHVSAEVVDQYDVAFDRMTRRERRARGHK